MNKIVNKQLKEFFKFLESKKYIILIIFFGLILLNMFIYKESFENGDSTKEEIPSSEEPPSNEETPSNEESSNDVMPSNEENIDELLEKCPECPVCHDDELNSQIIDLNKSLSSVTKEKDEYKDNSIENLNKLTNLKNKIDQLKGINKILKDKNGIGNGGERLENLNSAEQIFAQINTIYS